MKTRVVVVDDSALVRSLLAEIINRQPDMECVGAAADPLVAREMIRNLNPDVITLDVEMPRMDGIDFLSKLMRLRPMPVVMVSTLTERGAEVTLRALELGAVDFVAKPKIGVADGLQQLADDITDKVRVAAQAPTCAKPRRAARRRAASAAAPSAPATPTSIGRLSTEKIIFIGASTGGTEATKELLMGLPADAPAVMITQHMPPGFTRNYATRLDSLCRISVKEASDGERVLPGHAYIAPGGLAPVGGALRRQLRRPGARRRAGQPPQALGRGAVPVGRARGRPERAGRHAHRHGRRRSPAMRMMRDAGAWNVAQDEASCVVFGMPREAIAHGAAHEVLPLQRIAHALIERLRATAHRPGRRGTSDIPIESRRRSGGRPARLASGFAAGPACRSAGPARVGDERLLAARRFTTPA